LSEKTILIYNPAAGKGSAGQHLPLVQKRLEGHGFAYKLLMTEGPGHAMKIAQEAAESGCPLVVAAGGDGTINETINGLMRANLNGNPRPVLGVIPNGSGNDFAFGMGIPHELDAAIDSLVAGKRRFIDVGRVSGGFYPDGRYFGNGVGLGFDAVVGFEAAKIKWLHGAASYLAGLVRTIFLYSKAPIYEITMDDNPPERRGFLMVSIMNGSRMGGSFHMAPQSDPGDGQFDLCLASYVAQWKILPLATKFISGTQSGHPAICMTKAKRVKIQAIGSKIPAHADGETICTAGELLQIELIPHAIEVISSQA
jgi:diacylglycerol kinase (ATP)